ncbi:MAG: hypothetical protein KAJ07_12530 [Planctomycetes bacterium]|nr:hypothetical protein [Planctomycetota bacterium]
MIKCSRSDLSKSIFIVMFLVTGLSFCCNGQTQKSYGGASVEKIESVGGDLSFVCDVKDWPTVIGSDVKIIVKGIEPPGVLEDNGAADGFYRQQVKEFVRKVLKKAEVIELKNIERAETFALKANVIVDGRNLARQLIDKGFAQVRKKKEIEKKTDPKSQDASNDNSLVASKSGKVFHASTCSFVKRISKENIVTFTDKAQAEATGRRPCKTCKP